MNLTLTRQPLGQLLLGRGVVAPPQLEVALAEQRRTQNQKLLGEILVESRLCSEEQIAEALADSYGVPFARVSPRVADPKVIATLPRDFLEREQVLPLFLVEGMLTVAVVEPANVFLLDEIARLTGHTVQPVAATAADIDATLRAYLPGDGLFVIDDAHDASYDAAPDNFSVVPGAGKGEPAGASPVRRLALACLYGALKESATDVHIDPDDGHARVRYRVDGRLVERMRPPAHTHAAVVAELKAMAGLDPARPAPADGTIRVRSDRRVVELRLSVALVAHGEKVVVRVGDGSPPPRLEKLGFGYDTLKQWRRLLAGRGLLLVTGPAAGGKRTTVCSTAAELDAETLSVCATEGTLDPPVPGVNVFRADPAAGEGRERAAALRALLAQDPDVALHADLSDPESARLAVGAAMSGRLVIASLHAQGPAAAITRLLSFGVEPYALGAALAAVLAQRLVRRLCPGCREAYDATATERKQLEKLGGPIPTLHRPKGCPRCRGTGYAGRIGLFELLVPGDEFPAAPARGTQRPDAFPLIHPPGTHPLRADAAEKLKTGVTTLHELLCVLA